MLFQFASAAPQSDLYDLILYWRNLGVFDVVLPFLLVFAIVYALLAKMDIFKSKPVNIIVSLVLGLFFVRNQYLVLLTQRFLPNMALIITIALLFLLLLGVFTGGEHKGFTQSALFIAFIVSLFAIGWSLSTDYVPDQGLGGNTNILGSFWNWWYSIPQTGRTGIVVLIVIGIIIWWLSREKPAAGGPGGLMKGINNFLEGLGGTGRSKP